MPLNKEENLLQTLIEYLRKQFTTDRQDILRNTDFCIPHNTTFIKGIEPNTQY